MGIIHPIKMKIARTLIAVISFTTITLLSCDSTNNSRLNSADVVIYGGTSAGISAAIQTARLGKSVILIEPTNRLGGLTTGGLGQTDIGNKQVIGGIAREFYQNIYEYYQDSSNWVWQKKAGYKDGGQTQTGKNENTMWTFEPSAALKVFHNMIKGLDMQVVYRQRLDRKNGVDKTNGAIQTITMESGKTYSGKIFIDATYEGDLLAAADISYTVGREPNAKYGETLNGVQTKLAKYHQFPDYVDPYIVKDNPESGLLPNVNKEYGEEGNGDKKVQAYCFRMCLTNVPENRVTVEKPGGYNELDYELLFRAIEAGYSGPFFKMSKMPNGKTDSNNDGPFSTDYIGRNYNYPKGDYSTRTEIVKSHEIYQKGLLWTLANHPRIPKEIREEYSSWGLPKDEFIDNGHWTPQLYIREARRMVSDFVMTEHHCTQDSITAEQSVGMGAYTMDSHHTQRYITEEGFVKNEGDVEVGGFAPYPISYKALVPKKSECINLVVPVCLSATHIAFGSIRMEPVFMVLGQSSALVACLAIDEGKTVQDLEYTKLEKELIKQGQILR